MPPAVHPEWDAFRSAIVAEPDDDTSRLVAADWLDEHGDPDRAAFIRIQVALATQLAIDHRSLEVDRLRKEERAYLGPLSHFRGLWGAIDCPQLVRVKPVAGRGPLAVDVTGENSVHFCRGFVETVTLPAVEWLHHGEAVRARRLRRRRRTGAAGVESRAATPPLRRRPPGEAPCIQSTND